MFQLSQQPRPESHLLRKMRIHHQNIRRRQKDEIIGKLREQALLPIQLVLMLDALPTTLLAVSTVIQTSQLDPSMKSPIARKILAAVAKQPTILFTSHILSYEKKNTLLMFLARYSSNELHPSFNSIISLLKADKKGEELAMLFIPITAMLRRKDDSVLQAAAGLLQQLEQDRFYYSQLAFYDTALRNYAGSLFGMELLSESKILRLSQSIEVQFYSREQRLKMVQILIQVLYLSEKQTVSSIFNLEKLYPSLQYYIAYAKDEKMLTQRCLILIFNILIDRGSQQFLCSSCFESIRVEMYDSNNPQRLRRLMADVYLNAIVNYDPSSMQTLLLSQKILLFQTLDYLLNEFEQDSETIKIIAQVLDHLLNIGSKELTNMIQNWMIQSRQSYNILKNNEIGEQLLSEWQIS